MALEDDIKELTAAVKENTAVMREVIGMAPASGGSASSGTDTDTSEEPPKRKRGEPSPGKKRRTKEEVKEDEAAAAAEDAAKNGGNDDGLDTEEAGDGVSFDALKKNLAGWLGEFGKEEDKENPDGIHPEVTARKDALRKVFGSDKVAVENLKGLEADDKGEARQVVWDWLEGKAKKIDRGFGEGRLAADPEPEESGGDDDGLDI